MSPCAHTYYIKNMLCHCCMNFLKIILHENHYQIQEITLGKISVSKEPFSESELQSLLQKYGFDIVKNREEIIVEKIKQSVIELIHYSNNVNSIIRKSDYLIEKLNMSYSNISRIFSKYNPYTLERYILLQKIERVKELILQDEYTLSEIAYMMDFSSIHHLSNTFKKITGVTMTEFKEHPELYKKDISLL